MTLADRDVSLPVLLARAALTWPDRRAAGFPDATLTFRELYNGAAAVAAQLAILGVAPGDHVGLFMPNSADALAALFGVCLAGAVPVPLNSRYRSAELPYVIEHSDMVGLITESSVSENNLGEEVSYPGRLLAALPELSAQAAPEPLCLARAPRLRFIATLGSAAPAWVTSWPTGEQPPYIDRERYERIGVEQPALILYTSGTTARPKACLISHRALARACINGAVDRLGMDLGEVIWNPAPLCHISAYVALLGALYAGGVYVTAPYYDPDITLRQLVDERVTVSFANFPAFYFALGKVLADSATELPALRLLTTAATPAEIERIRKIFPGVMQISVSGSTEVSGCACINDLTDSPDQRATSAGRPIDGIEVSIRHPELLSELPAGAVGEIWFRGPCLFTGYYKDPRPVLTGDPVPGWFRTGDLGTVDAGGRMSFRGRIKDMLKVGGENVSAAELEEFLLSHPAVAVAQVVGRSDERLGEVPVAFIEVTAGHELTEADVIALCRDGLAGYKVPRAVRFVSEWPMSATKIQKHVLRELVQQPA
jgi:acyl-CoA synthetase (AMP-forming)/AMP-acid ligase II